MKRAILLLCLAVVLCAIVGSSELAGNAAASNQADTLTWYVFGGGGQASFELGSTIGQNAVGFSIGTHQIGAGFWYGITRAKDLVYLPLVIRNP